MALQRNLKALGTFGYQTTARRNPVYIQYIPRTLRYVRNNLANRSFRPDSRAARDARGGVSLSGRPRPRESRMPRVTIAGSPTSNWQAPGNALRNFNPSLPRASAESRPSGDHCVVRVRGGRGVRDAEPLRLSRSARRSSSSIEWLKETGLALHEHSRADRGSPLARATSGATSSRTRSATTRSVRRPSARPMPR